MDSPGQQWERRRRSIEVQCTHNQRLDGEGLAVGGGDYVGLLVLRSILFELKLYKRFNCFIVSVSNLPELINQKAHILGHNIFISLARDIE